MSIIFEFALLGVFAAGLVYLFIFVKRKMPESRPFKYATALALLTAFLLFWVNGAVGIIGSEDNDANMMFFGVLGIGLAGVLVARFKPHGMASAMFITALAQILVAVIALAAGLGSSAEIWPKDVIVATLIFTTLWLGSALLYRKSARAELVAKTQ